MTVQIEEFTREQVAVFLPAALQKAFSSYEEFMMRGIDKTKPDEFSKHHTACKVALAHVQLLLRLAQWANVPVNSDQNHTVMMEIALNEARGERFLDSEKIGEET